jgi:hypothetical protein
VRRKEAIVITVLILAAAYGAFRIGRAAVQSFRQLPRRNEDMVLF